jgi:aminopeptidase N
MLVLGLALALGPVVGVSATDGPYAPGAAGLGDPYYPDYGNGGYDVQDYDLRVTYLPKTDQLWGVATISVEATQGLSRFNLDLIGLTVREVKVDGAPASWSRTDHELTIVPAAPIADGARFSVRVRYDGVPITAYDPFAPDLQIGFMHTNDGAIVSGEPDVAAFWYPCNDHPRDRATYTFRVTVPERYDVVANGLPVGVHDRAGWATHVWRAADPMAAYLATIDIGRWVIHAYETERGLPVIDAIDPSRREVVQHVLARQEEVLAFLEDTFGIYPMETAGAIVDDHPGYMFAMEMQTRPVYPSSYFVWGQKSWALPTVLHELAHMWFGDMVSVDLWRDIWLNEGFASYAEWLWAEHEGVATTQQILEAVWGSIPAEDPFWQIVVADPGAADMFSDAVYTRGAMTVQALRAEVGDRAFWRIVSAWLDRNAWSTGSTAEFIAVAEQVSGRQLDAFFQTWVFATEKPPADAVLASARGSRVGATATPAATRWTHRWIRSVQGRTR